MKTKPILFNTEMVQAVLEGRKTQTRRLKGLEGVNLNPDNYDFNCIAPGNANEATFKVKDRAWKGVKVPYVVGDVIWVRETFSKNEKDSSIILKADNLQPFCGGWKPSIFMPKEACRLFLK